MHSVIERCGNREPDCTICRTYEEAYEYLMNRGATLERAIKGHFEQSNKQYEWVVLPGENTLFDPHYLELLQCYNKDGKEINLVI